MITDYKYVIPNNIEFQKLRDGDTFEYHNTLYFKIPCIAIKTNGRGNSYYDCNAIRIADLNFVEFEKSDKVLPVDSKLFIYK